MLAEEDGTIRISNKIQTGGQANFPLLAIRPQFIPENAEDVKLPEQNIQGISGAVWLDIKRGGIRGKPEEGKSGLPAIRVEAVQDGQVIATAYTDTDGSYSLENLQDGEYTIRLNESNFRRSRSCRWGKPLYFIYKSNGSPGYARYRFIIYSTVFVGLE